MMDSIARAWVPFLYLIFAGCCYISVVGLCWRQLELRFDADFRVGRRVSHVGDTIDNPITARGGIDWGIGLLKHTANSVILISYHLGKLRLRLVGWTISNCYVRVRVQVQWSGGSSWNPIFRV